MQNKIFKLNEFSPRNSYLREKMRIEIIKMRKYKKRDLLKVSLFNEINIICYLFFADIK